VADLRISKFIRIDPAALREEKNDDGRSLVLGPIDFVHSLKPGFGIVEASWDESRQLGCATRYGVVVSMKADTAEVRWIQTDATYRPNPAGRRWWKQTKPFFSFAPEVAERYLLAAAFSEHFPEGVALERNSGAPHVRLPRPSNTPTGGYVYLVRSQYGIKIGKSVNVKSRTRLFEVKLPFPISVEHYAWFEDYSFAERQLHTIYHAKRLEGEWFDLSDQDVAHIRTLGKSVPVEGL
jgi:hypothetical protein